MKIKLLLAPMLIVMIMTFLIWMVYPAYTNGVDGVSEKTTKLDQQKAITGKLAENLANVQKMKSDLDLNVTGKKTIFDYIPKDKEDEKIIENLNFLAMKNSLVVLNISVAEVAEVAPSIVAAVPAPDPDSTTPVAGADGATPGGAVPIPPKVVEPKKLSANFSVLGSYENIRIILDSLYKMKRFNKISSLELKTVKTTQPAQTTTATTTTTTIAPVQEVATISNLQITMKLEFDYLLNNYKLSDSDINNEVFSKGVFADSVIAEIDSNKNVNVNNVLPGEVGKNNPFILPQ